MEQTLDLPVHTQPLVHVTKRRIKNNSRKNSVPSRSHLKRNSIGDPFQQQSRDVIAGNVANQDMEQKLPLKLPPPPVPKKPKINMASLPIATREITAKDELDADLKQNKSEELIPKKKPAIAPKPKVSRPDSITIDGSPVINSNSNGNSEKRHLEKFVNVEEALISQNDSNGGLASPSKSKMSFTERLKASSLSRRKDGGGSNGFLQKSRSHIISPIRRGSRTFMNTDISSSESNEETKQKLPKPIFKRYSSDASINSDKSSLSVVDDVNETNFDMDEFKNLSISPVRPLPVSSVLTEGNSSDEDEEKTKDSFDSGELNIAKDLMSLKKEISGNIEIDYKGKFDLTEVENLNEDLNVPPISSNSETSELPSSSYSKSKNSVGSYFDQKESKIFSEVKSKDHEEKQEHFREYDSILIQGNQGSVVNDEYNKKALEKSENNAKGNKIVSIKSPLNDELKLKKVNAISSNAETSRFETNSKFGLSTREGTVRRKFEPVGFNKATLKLEGKPKEKDDGRKYNARIDVCDNEISRKSQESILDTDSSLEDVTPDIDQNFSFEILSLTPNPDDPGSIPNEKIEIDGSQTIFSNIKKDEDKYNRSAPDQASDLPHPGMKFTWTGIEQLEEQLKDSHMLFVGDEPVNIEEDVTTETVQSLDVEMLPIVQPPPMADDDDMDTDELLNLIDPPTVYEDVDDDGMETFPVLNIASSQSGDNFFNINNENKAHSEELILDGHRFLPPDAEKEISEFDFEQGFDETDLDNPKENFDNATLGHPFEKFTYSKDKRDDVDDDVGDDDGFDLQQEVHQSPDMPQNRVLSLAADFDSVVNKETSTSTKRIPHEYESKNEMLNLNSYHDKLKETNDLRKLPNFTNFENPSPPLDEHLSIVDHTKNIVPFKKVVVEETDILPSSVAKLEEENKYEITDSFCLIGAISEKGKHRKKSFTEKCCPKDVSGSPMNLENQTEDNEVSRNHDLKDENDYLHEITTEQSAQSNMTYSGEETSPNTRRRDNSHFNELLDPIEPNKLSPWSSFEYLPDSGKPSSRKSSLCSTNKSGTDGEIQNGESLHKRWSSFCSSSGDEQNGKKLNIIKLMRERTISQNDTIDDFDRNENILELGIDFQRDSKDIDDSDDESKELVEDGHDANFDSLPLDEWTIEDVGEWLEMIGLTDLRPQFEEKKIGGHELLAIDLQLLDDIGITNIEDREMILSEIYALKNPEDLDIEMSLLDALDNASGYDREKMLAVLEALKMSQENEVNHYLPSPPPKLSASRKTKSKPSKKGKETYRRAVSEYSPSAYEDQDYNERSKSASPRRRAEYGGHSLDTPISAGNKRKDKKSSKKKSFFREALSFRRKGSARIARLFSSRKKLVDSSLKYILQPSSQGIVKIWTQSLIEEQRHKGDDSSSVSLLVTSTTNAADVIKTVLEKLDLIEDVNCFYLVQSHISKSVPQVVLEDDDCPLVLQCRWPDAERYKFELKKKFDGEIIIVHSEDGLNDERSMKIETMLKTTCSDIIAIALKRFQKSEPVKSFSLYQMNGSKEGSSTSMQDSQIPMDACLLRINSSRSKPAVYQLVKVNFLGSPEKSFKQGNNERHKVELLELKLKEKEEILAKLYESQSLTETQLKDVVTENKALTTKIDIQDKQITELEDIAESLRKEVDEQNGDSSLLKSSKETHDEMIALSGKLDEREEETKSLNRKIFELKLDLEARDENIASLKNVQNENEQLTENINKLQIELAKKDEILQEMTKLANTNEELQRKLDNASEEVEERNKEILELRNEDASLREQFTSKLELKVHKIEQMKIEIDELRQKSNDRKLANTNEALQRKLDHASEEVEERNKEILELRNKDASLREQFTSKLELKDQRIEQMKIEIDELRRISNDRDEELKILRKSAKEFELSVQEKESQLKKSNDLHKEYLNMQNHMESLQQSLIEKDSEKLNLEIKLQKAERELQEMENLIRDRTRENSQFSVDITNLSQRVKELQDELNSSKRALLEKESLIAQLREKGTEEKMKIRFETLQELLSSKEATWKDKEARLIGERDEQRSKCVQLEDSLDAKDAHLRKQDAKVAKLEKITKENMKKFEKFMSDKDRVLRQVREESTQEIKDLKLKIQQMNEALAQREKHAQQLSRSGSISKEFEVKLKQKEEENKQHKFLLERLMSVVNDKDPGILEEFENSFGQASNKISDKEPLLRKAEEDWC